MSLEFCLLIVGAALLPWLVLVPLLVVIGVLILLPRRVTRQVRHRLMDFVLWQWIQGSHISSRAHKWLWNEGNGGTDQAKK